MAREKKRRSIDFALRGRDFFLHVLYLFQPPLETPPRPVDTFRVR